VISDSVTEKNVAPQSGFTGSKDPYEIGTVDTAFKLIWPDHKIEVWGVPDPKISGITCFYSRAKKWGISGGLGVAEDTSDASVSCRKTGDIIFRDSIKETEEIWNESTSFFFKKLRIVRFYDKNSNSLVYLVYSDRLVDGSPKNSISAIALEWISPKMQ
jgi:CreA protein